ncbi:Stk1 family PASTA domain-containing Ser/Thr kinase [Clostridium tetani]|uniref:non-specific serine/threonine protein kinase n=2 Tax=Clostridium tetani TaxID=1513 RepID=A0ABY0EP50_CLOTA|nr:Stk1 family PASTA domain-containing Ser/Thr kinase [Clostridium tetani]RXI51827.1 Stk1 family PASTA domain-containing Ser/Thr kinase [Clostridium tetani]RXI73948.1 Stk1 family PASTA domain-containing Ser/Thr kinase [Clostridium tetani]
MGKITYQSLYLKESVVMIGTLLGNRYELLEKVGEGGMAEVYKAKCHFLNRYVAVKILKEEFSRDAQFVEKFKREATAAASISDNNIVNIYDVGSEENINYIVMEYVQGETLKDVIRKKGKIPYKEAVKLAIQIAKGLECAHRNNIIHRDIKPHNILVTADNLVKVTDFGIAKATNSVTITNTSQIMGSVHYFSPEQAKGGFIDFRTDIYSLGIVLYEMVTGQLPYNGETAVSIALKHIQGDFIPPKTINPSLSESLNSIILKCMEKEPIKRYQNVGELINDLKKIENNEQVNIESTNIEDDRTRVMSPINVDDFNDELEDDGQYYEEDRGKPISSKNKKTIVTITAVILVLCVGFLSGYVIYNKRLNGSKSVTVPKIVGLHKDEAKKIVEAQNLVFQIVSVENSDKPEGTVLKASPEEGAPIKAKSEVRVVVSGGKEKLKVPDLHDIDLEVAKDILNRYDLRLGNVSSEYSNNVSSNSVIRQSPEKGSEIELKSKIDLVISKGPEVKYATVPNLNSKTLDEVKNLLENAKLKLGNQRIVETSDKNLDGKIFAQTIEANTQVKEGTSVSISYYAYKEPEIKPEEPTEEPTDQEDENNNITTPEEDGKKEDTKQDKNKNSQ